jgi:hypothetical protein
MDLELAVSYKVWDNDLVSLGLSGRKLHLEILEVLIYLVF